MPNNGGGRKTCSEWNEVVYVDQSTKVACKHCKELISRKIERIKTHLQKCKTRKMQDPDEEVSDCGDFEASVSHSQSNRKHEQTNLQTEKVIETIEETENSNSKRKRMQSSLSSFVVKTSKEQEKICNTKIAAFFYSANIPFSVVENPQFIDMISALRPGYLPPSRKQLSGQLLSEASSVIEYKMKDDIEVEGTTLTVVQDGWSSVRNDPIVACSLHTGSKSYLMKITDAGSNKKTAEYCAEDICTTIEECKVKFHKNVFAICTDNEPKMQKMKFILKEKYPHILTFGCSAHYLNLVAKQISPKALLNQISEVQKYFRNSHQPHGWLKEHGCVMPKLPCETRWNSQEDCVSSFLENFHKYVQIASQNKTEFNKQISNILDNVGIYKEAINLQKQLSCLSNALNKLQKDSTTLSEAVEIWKDLLESNDLQSYQKVLVSRYEQHIGPEHFLANMTDPKFEGKRLSPDEENQAELWLAENHGDWLPFFMAFRIKDEDYFSKSLFSKNVVSEFTSAKWWNIMKHKTIKRGKLDPDFCYFLKSLHSVPPTSASIERIFSTFGFIWSKLRNRLGYEQAEKLVKIYRFYHQQSNKKIAEEDW